MNNILRPKKLQDLIGQQDIKKILEITIGSAIKRKDVLPHIALSSYPGLGKSTIAECIANEMGANLFSANGAAIRNIKSIVPYILKVNYGDILFIDEIHRCSKQVQEYLFTVLEDFFCILGKNEDIVKINIPHFTMIIATTEFGSLLRPFRDRFKTHLTLTFYSVEDLTKLAIVNAKKLKVDIESEAAAEIARRSRNTPRFLNRYLEWCRDFTINNNQNKITLENVISAMNLSKIDENSFTSLDRQAIICLKAAKTPIALNTLASILRIDEKTIVDEIEPFLISKGLLGKCTKGRYYCGKE